MRSFVRIIFRASSMETFSLLSNLSSLQPCVYCACIVRVCACVSGVCLECVCVCIRPLALRLLSVLQGGNENVHHGVLSTAGQRDDQFCPSPLPQSPSSAPLRTRSVPETLAGTTQLPRSESHTHTHTHLAGMGQLPCSR